MSHGLQRRNHSRWRVDHLFINDVMQELEEKGYPTFSKIYFYIHNHRSWFQIIADLEIKEESTVLPGENNCEIINDQIDEFIRKIVFRYGNMRKNSMLFNLKTDKIEYALTVTIIRISSNKIIKLKPSENDFEARFAIRIDECIKEAGAAGISLSGIVAKTQYIGKSVRKNILDERINLGLISAVIDSTYKKKKTIYTWIGDNG
jgi:hypothetical protein